MTKLERIQNVVARVIGHTPDALSNSSIIMDIPGMSSLVYIRYIVALEQEFHIRFDNRTILEMVTIGDILKKLGDEHE